MTSRLIRVIDWLFSPFEVDHCRSAYLNDVQKTQAEVDAILLTLCQAGEEP